MNTKKSNEKRIRVKSAIKAGGLQSGSNHNRALAR